MDMYHKQRYMNRRIDKILTVQDSDRRGHDRTGRYLRQIMDKLGIKSDDGEDSSAARGINVARHLPLETDVEVKYFFAQPNYPSALSTYIKEHVPEDASTWHNQVASTVFSPPYRTMHFFPIK